jgi:hypothetical protein
MKALLYLSSFIAVLFFLGCKKDNSPSSSQWSFSGESYSGTRTTFDSGILLSNADSSAIFLTFSFDSVKAGTYAVAGTLISSGDSTCGIVISNYNQSTHGFTNYYSIGKKGDEVNVKYLGDKIEVSFNNITLENPADSTLINTSGTIIQQ